jgi:glutathione S-transferase/glutamate synthase domain-containing protein 1
MTAAEYASQIIASRIALIPEDGFVMPHDEAAEGGCGVIGMASNVQVAAQHMLQSLKQMRNRGNGKGGGIAAVGLVPEEFGVSQEILDNDYLVAIAYLDSEIREELEAEFIDKVFEVDHIHVQEHLADYTALEGLEVPPPEVIAYFVRVKPDQVEKYRQKFGIPDAPKRTIEDEIVFQNSFHLNIAYYKSTGEKRAFVLSHGKNLLVLKMVGYGDDVIRYYQIEDMQAHVWIGHHRYPTKGRVWHPGGAHPFIGLNEALMHNGDFANHASISEYLAQRNIFPLFLTDTEVAVQVFDLLHRTYGYPLEYVVEAMAPTTERDFTLLPPEKQKVYRMLQQSHMHCSPDGPWFFLIAQSEVQPHEKPVYRLTGITDTSMLRPQVFAWQENTLENGEKAAIGFAASEKQGIDAALTSLAASDSRFWSRADKYWNARGGSHVDGGAFLYSVSPNGQGMDITCTDKFGRPLALPTSTRAYSDRGNTISPESLDIPAEEIFAWYKDQILRWDYDHFEAFLEKNPNGRIPLLELPDGRHLAESNAILCYLADGSALYGGDAFAKSQILQWLFFEQYSHEPYIATSRFIIQYLGSPPDRLADLAQKKDGGYQALGVMDRQLDQHHFMTGDTLTIADIALFAYTHVANEGDFSLANYPHVRAWIDRIRSRPNFVKM